MQHKSLKSSGFCLMVPMPSNVLLKSLNIQYSTNDRMIKLPRASMFHKSLGITGFCLVKPLKYYNASNIIELTVLHIRQQRGTQKS